MVDVKKQVASLSTQRGVSVLRTLDERLARFKLPILARQERQQEQEKDMGEISLIHPDTEQTFLSKNPVRDKRIITSLMKRGFAVESASGNVPFLTDGQV